LVGASGGEAGDGGGGEVEVLEALGAGEGEEEAFVAGVEIGNGFGPYDVAAEVDDFVGGEGVVEGEEAAHGFGGVECEDAQGLRRGGFVLDEEAAEVGGAGTRSHG